MFRGSSIILILKLTGKNYMDVISLTKKLISFNTINPPGNEAQIAEFTGGILAENGFVVEFFDFGEGRKHLIAEKGVTGSCRPLIFSGHFDTVPLGDKKWEHDPVISEIVRRQNLWSRLE